MRKKEQIHENRLQSLRTAHETEKRAIISAHDSELRALRTGGPSGVSVGASCTTATPDSKEVALSVKQRLDAEIGSLKSANAVLKRALHEQEGEKESLTRTAESSQSAHEAVMADHQSLQHYHQQLNADYERLAKEVGRLKSDKKRMAGDLEDARKRVWQRHSTFKNDSERP